MPKSLCPVVTEAPKSLTLPKTLIYALQDSMSQSRLSPKEPSEADASASPNDNDRADSTMDPLSLAKSAVTPAKSSNTVNYALGRFCFSASDVLARRFWVKSDLDQQTCPGSLQETPAARRQGSDQHPAYVSHSPCSCKAPR